MMPQQLSGRSRSRSCRRSRNTALAIWHSAPNGLKDHVLWLKRHWHNLNEEIKAKEAVASSKPMGRAELNEELNSMKTMLRVVATEHDYHTEHYECEELALDETRKQEAIEVHRHLDCPKDGSCSFWYILRKGRRPRRYFVNFFCENGIDMLWPSIVYTRLGDAHN
jgi:hypothetical protein